MPAVYAHYRFGKIVAGRVNGFLGEIINQYSDQFEIGLQGPDIFFFYRPYKPNWVVKYGHRLHQVSALPFFSSASKVIQRYGRSSKEYAYLLGFICHFALDSRCHGRIDQMIKETGVKHLEIEEEFDKYLLRCDGRDPLKFPLAQLICVDDEICRSIAPFYENINDEIVKRALLDLRRIKRLFTAPGVIKQGVINSAMRLTGKYPYIKGLMHQRKDNPRCIVTSEELKTLFDEAVDGAISMMRSFDESLLSGQIPDERFDRNFK